MAEVQIDELGGRINLNDLVSPAGQVDTTTRDRLARLLQVLDISDVSVDAIVDWIDDNDQTTSAYGAEDGEYLLSDPSYRAANQPFASVTELRLIRGMTEEAFTALLPHVAALPVHGTGINVNFATGAVLQSLHQELTPAQAESILEKRAEERFENLQDFLALPEFAGLGLKSAGLGLRSRFLKLSPALPTIIASRAWSAWFTGTRRARCRRYGGTPARRLALTRNLSQFQKVKEDS